MNLLSLFTRTSPRKSTPTPLPTRARRRAAILGIATLGLLLALAAPAAAQAPGTPSGNGVVPVVVAGNPDCAALGLAFGFKIDGSPNGTFPLTSPPGELTGGAPPDPANSFTLANSDGTHFDWSASLGMDAVIVKAGPNANVYHYVPEATSDTALHGPVNPGNGQPYDVSHVEACYDYEVDVAKSADTTFTRTWQWDLDKAVAPAAWELFTGDSGTSRYVVGLDRTGFTDSDWAVGGDVLVENGTPFDVTLTGVADVLTGGIVAPVDCGVVFPWVLASGDALACTYAAPLPDGTERTNTATVTTAPGPVGGGEARAAVLFGDPTAQVNAEVTVTDSNGLSWGPVADDATWTYERTFTCGTGGIHPNVATIVETGQSDDASVSVGCHGLEVAKTAATDFTRTWSWSLDKTADAEELTLAPGQTYLVGYAVAVSALAVDGDWSVGGEIVVSNPHPSREATLAAVSDRVAGLAATVDCPALAVPPGGSLVCTYQAALPDGGERTNRATATLQNVSIAADGTVSPAGTTDFPSPPVPVVFGEPGTVVDACIDVDDSLAGSLGTVCSDGAPTTLAYTWTVGPFASPDDCGENRVDNTARFVAADSGASGEDGWTVVVTVPCDFGCTLTPGYWKTHSPEGPAPLDETWYELAAAEDTPFFLSGQTWYEVLWTPPRGNAWYILARAWAAASLNFLNGASAPPEVLDAWDEATTLFETWTPEEIGAFKGNKPPRPRFLELAGLLDMYNNGLVGPGHCSEDAASGQ